MIRECKEAPNIFHALYEQGKVYGETLERLSNNFSVLQKNIEDFIETKRLAFPRLFFLNDTQFIDFLTKLKNQDNYDFYISQLFPGASGLFFKKSQQDIEIPPQIINDISVLDQEFVEEPRAVRSMKSLQKTIDVSLSENLKVSTHKIFDYNSTKSVLKDVLGMISQTKELFLFEKKVNITEKPESWLQKVEQSMQDTIGKNINYAVASFPKQSLDEWILDHPQQIILTTIHLILTHEVNELFEEMRKTRKANRQEEYDEDGEGEGSSYEDDNSRYMEDDEATPKTPNTRDLIKHSIASSMLDEKRSSQNSYRSSLRGLKTRKDDKKHSVAEENKEINMGDRYNHSIHPGRNSNKAAGNTYEMSGINPPSDENNDDVPQDERHKFAANMFGSDFDIDLVVNNENDDRDAVMDTLQEKSFRGLFLRLQFWINQICKSLHGKGKQMELDLPVVHRIIMKSIVCFLNYMRDVVFDLKQKNITHAEHYEWQKQIRLTWNGRENGCKVD